MGSLIFHVGRNALCYWDDEPDKTNLRSLEFVAPHFFLETAAALWNQKPITEYNDPRIDNLIIQYWIAMEAVLSLLAALVQAPNYFYGWIVSSNSEALDFVLDAIRNGDDIPRSATIERLNWPSVSKWLFSGLDDGENQFIGNFSKLWSTIANEFMVTERREAYNRIKHGFGAKKNALKSVTIDKMTFPVVGGQFGHQFLTSEKIEGNRLNLSLVEKIVHWEPTHCIQAIEYVGMSIHNISQVLKARFTRTSGKLDLFVPSNDTVENFVRRQVPTQHPISLRLQSVSYPNPLPTREEIRAAISDQKRPNSPGKSP